MNYTYLMSVKNRQSRGGSKIEIREFTLVNDRYQFNFQRRDW